MACRYTYKGKTYEVSEFDDLLRAMSPAEASKFMPSVKAVPEAPFVGKTTDWLALAMKRVIKMAVDEGYDRVAFVNGEQSAERYDLSKHIDRIDYNKNGDGTYSLSAIKDGREVFSKEELTPEQLADHVGKDVAEKIVNGEGKESAELDPVDRWEADDSEHNAKDFDYGKTQPRSLSGLDLKVGGEGMKAFYDKIVPSVAKDVVKKLGGDGLYRPSEVAKPDDIVKHYADLGKGRESMVAALKPEVDAGVVAALQHDQVAKAVVEALPVDVVDMLASKGISAEEFTRDPKVLITELPADSGLTVADGLSRALSQVGANLRAGLDAAYKARLDQEVLPALRASDLSTKEAALVAFAPRAAAHGARLRAESRAAAMGGGGVELDTAARAKFEEWHGSIVSHSGGDVLSNALQFNVTDKMRERAAGGVPLFQKDADVPRGSIRFGDGKAVISLFENADPSTLIHESGHAWLEEMLFDANRPDAPGQIRDDARIVMEWLANDGGEITTDQHEQFARAVEAYMLEGKAPSPGLASVFARFKQWLTKIYRTVAALDTPINDDIRQVFDRLLATDEQIAEATRSTGLEPNFKDRAEAGMTSAEWGAYKRAIEKANLEAESTMLDKMMARVRRARSAEYRAERAIVEAAVATEVDKRPDIAALNVMRSGKLPDGTEQRVRFSTEAIREMYGEAGAASLPHGIMAKDGLHPDVIAEMMGLESGDQLVKALQALEQQQRAIRATEGEKRTVRKFLIDQETDAQMDARRGELMDEGAIREEALAAVHGDARAELLAVELRYLRRMGAQALVDQGKGRQEAGTDQPPGRGPIQAAVWNEQAGKDMAAAMRESVTVTKPMLEAIRTHVEAILQNRTTADVGRFEQYLRDERKAAGEVQKAILKKDWAGAAAAKQRQILSNVLYTRGKQAAAEIERGVAYLSRLQDGENKSIEIEYRGQIEALLERFDLRKVSDKAIARRESLKAFLDRMELQGIVPVIPEKLLDEANRTHYKQMSYEDFTDLIDSVKSIEHIGRLKNKLLTARAERDFTVARDNLVASIEEHAGDREANTRTPATDAERAMAFVRRFGAAHIKVSTLVRVMDGGKDGGPMWEYLVRTANERGDMETTMRAKATAALTEIVKPILKGMTHRKFYASVKRSLTREQVIGMALNTGNAGNWQRMLGGEAWTIDQVRPVLQTLTAAEWKVVQGIWDHFETYRPLIGAKEVRVYGREPKWVEAVPFEVLTADGERLNMRGGYYPITFDPMASVRAEQHADAEGAKRQLQGAYTSATTRRGFTKERVEEVRGRPLMYSLKGIYGGVNDVIHDLSWHEWLIDANKIMRSDKVDHAIRSTYGPDVVRQFKTWINDVAEGEKGLQVELDGALGQLRHGVSIAGLGFNVMSALVQPLGLTQSMVRIGVEWVGKGVAQYIAHPIDTTRRVNADSEFMSNRARTRFRELNELRNQVEGQSSVKRVMGTYAYWMMMRMQQAVDVPTWTGAFEKATAEGNAKERAVALADQAVIDAQGSGMVKDLSSIERGGPAQKLFTVFYSFMNTALNMGVGQTMAARTPAKKAKLAADYLLLYVVPAVLGVALKDAVTPGDSGDWDDPEKLAKKLAKAQLDYLMGLMVVAREFAGAAKAVAGLEDHVRDYSGPAGVRLVADATDLSKQIGQVWDGGEFDDAFRKSLINVIGDMFGLPSAQTNRTISGTQALIEGKTDNPAAAVLGYQEPR